MITFVIAGACIASGVANAQVWTARIVVIDTAGRPLENADVAILRDTEHIVAEGPTDASGMRMLSFRRDVGTYEVRARRLGFVVQSRLLIFGSADTIQVRLELATLPRHLRAVVTTAEQDLKHKYLFIDSAQISRSRRQIRDAADIITKLRPDMIYGLGGKHFCGAIQDVWINGRRIDKTEVIPDVVAVERARGTILKPRRYVVGPDEVPDFVISLLSRIKPEHIAEMRYRDCMDMSLGLLHGENALFIVLKPGVQFSASRGTYEHEAGVIDSVSDSNNDVRAYRRRLLGVFDEGTGAPIADCIVADSATGVLARTTATGTISLAYLPEGASVLRLSKPGYRPFTIRIAIAPNDTNPITILLSRAP